jgi:hypothetical protein
MLLFILENQGFVQKEVVRSAFTRCTRRDWA